MALLHSLIDQVHGFSPRCIDPHAAAVLMYDLRQLLAMAWTHRNTANCSGQALRRPSPARTSSSRRRDFSAGKARRSRFSSSGPPGPARTSQHGLENADQSPSVATVRVEVRVEHAHVQTDAAGARRQWRQ
jgi:hypothetical protein